MTTRAAEAPPMAPILPSTLLDQLAQATPAEPCAIAFDADGTLWSGDVGEEMFLYALEHRLLKPEALPALQRVATGHNLPLQENASDQGRELFEAFERGQLPEQVACELMAWCYAGYRPEELRPHIQEALSQGGIDQRYFEPVKQVVDWARGRAIATVVVSASPASVVAEAAKQLGFAVAEIAGGKPLELEGKWQASLTYPLPYATTKVDAYRQLLPDTPLLAAFGDSVFDFELLSSAIIGVAVRPKLALKSRLHELAECRLLA